MAASGKYEIGGFATGEYRLTFTPDDNSAEDVKFKVKVPVNGGCTGTVARLGNTNVSGAVIDAVGAPISGVDVFLFFALDGKFHPEFALKTRTDANGRFTFYRAEASKFVLSAQLAASKMTFFPGTYDASKTRIIEVPAGTPVSGLTIRVLSR